MTLEEAAKSLRVRLEGAPWLTAVGVGEEKGVPGIVVYIKSVKAAKLDFLNQGWEGYPVLVRKMGTPRLVASFSPVGAKAEGE